MRRRGMQGASLSRRSRPQHGLETAFPMVEIKQGLLKILKGNSSKGCGKIVNTGCHLNGTLAHPTHAFTVSALIFHKPIYVGLDIAGSWTDVSSWLD